MPTQASILSRCRAPRCDRRPVRPKRNLRKRLENNLRTSGEKIVTRYTQNFSPGHISAWASPDFAGKEYLWFLELAASRISEGQAYGLWLLDN